MHAKTAQKNTFVWWIVGFFFDPVGSTAQNPPNDLPDSLRDGPEDPPGGWNRSTCRSWCVPGLILDPQKGAQMAPKIAQKFTSVWCSPNFFDPAPNWPMLEPFWSNVWHHVGALFGSHFLYFEEHAEKVESILAKLGFAEWRFADNSPCFDWFLISALLNPSLSFSLGNKLCQILTNVKWALR